MTTNEKPYSGSTVSPRFERFTITDVAYKHVGKTPVPASILIPNGISHGKRPVLVRWHGGGLVNGHRIHAEWFPPFILEHAVRTNAILISPDYRLLPDVPSALDILQDLKDFYSWLFTPGNLAKYLPEGVDADLSGILVSGESAGGWLALQSAFTQGDKIAAVISHFPIIDLRSDHFSTEDQKRVLEDLPFYDPKVLDEYFASRKPDDVVTSAMPPERFDLFGVLTRTGYTKWFGDDTKLYPLEMLDQVKSIAPVWILHGTADTAVPISGSEKFRDAFTQKFPDVGFHYSPREGKPHGFDDSIGYEDDWTKEGLDFIGKYWPKK